MLALDLHFPLRVVSRFTVPGPSLIASEPVACQAVEWGGAEPPPDGQERLAAVRSLCDRLDWVPPVAAAQTAFGTLAMAAVLLARYLLNMERGLVQTARARVLAPGRILLSVGMHDGRLALEALDLAWRLLDAAGAGDEVAVRAAAEAQVEDFARRCALAHPDYVARILMLGARRRNIPFMPSGVARVWQYGWGARGRPFIEAASNGDGLLGYLLARYKEESTRLLRSLGLPATEQGSARTLEEAQALARRLGPDAVIKPVDQGQGRGVTVGVNTEAEVAAAFTSAARLGGAVIVERCVPGDDYRLLVVDGRLVAAARREPGSVIGDGVSTVGQLVEAENAARRADPVKRRYLKAVKCDEAALRHLASQGCGLDTIPAHGRRLTLRGNANVSTGGKPTDVLAEVHPEVKAMCETIAHATGLRAIGIDYLTPDIGRPWREVGGAVIEFNTFPGLDVHVAAGYDETALGVVLLGSSPDRIPVIVAVAPAEELAALCEGLRDEAARLPPAAGVATPSRVFLRGLDLEAGRPPWLRAAPLLLNRQCRTLLVGCTPEEVARHGFPVDRCDLAVLIGTAWRDEPAGSTAAQIAARYSGERMDLPSLDEAAVGRIAGLLREAAGAPAVPPSPAPVRTPPPPALPEGVRCLRRRALSDGPSLFAMMRNESYLLPHFLDHYRRLGVENFLLYDDHSTDGCREAALDQPDCTVLTSERPFSEHLADGRLLHHLLKEAIPESLLADRWVAVVDLDEFLMLPDEFDGLAPFLDLVGSRGHDCVFGTMVDAYPATLAERAYGSDRSPFEGAPYFDADRGFRRRPDSPEAEKVFEGVRARLIAMLKREDPETYHAIFGGRGYLMPALFKVPLVKTGRGIVRRNAHAVNRVPPFDVEVALAHFKFGPDLDAKIADALATRAHYLESIEYEFLHAVTERFGAVDIRCDRTRRFDEPGALAAAGMVRTSP
ncbi:MAG: hypothetical protein GC201_16035 [Alphaproteobacteria bacterium]|nr:hypothetical protein [Alphaproteobacteria bacterium]